MPVTILAIVIDCRDSHAIASFWAAVLGRDVLERNPREYRVGNPERDGAVLYCMDVPEPKVAKNRLHLDVVTHGDLSEEVERLQGLGAVLSEVRSDPGVLANPDRWAVMADPEGNEFCVTSTSTLSGWQA